MTKVKMLLPDQLMNYNTATHIGTVTGSHFKPSGLGKLSRFFFLRSWYAYKTGSRVYIRVHKQNPASRFHNFVEEKKEKFLQIEKWF